MGRWFNRQQLGGAQSGKPPRDGKVGTPARPAPRGLPATVAEQRPEHAPNPAVPDGFDWRTANIDGPVDPRAAMQRVIEAKEVGPVGGETSLQARRDAIMAALPELREFLEYGGSPTFDPQAGSTADGHRFQPPAPPYGADPYRVGHAAPEAPRPEQYGAQPPRSDQYGGPIPRPDQYAGQSPLRSEPYAGSPPRHDQHAGQPRPDQYAGQPPSDPYGAPAYRHDQYAAQPAHADPYGAPSQPEPPKPELGLSPEAAADLELALLARLGNEAPRRRERPTMGGTHAMPGLRSPGEMPEPPLAPVIDLGALREEAYGAGADLTARPPAARPPAAPSAPAGALAPVAPAPSPAVGATDPYARFGRPSPSVSNAEVEALLARRLAEIELGTRKQLTMLEERLMASVARVEFRLSEHVTRTIGQLQHVEARFADQFDSLDLLMTQRVGATEQRQAQQYGDTQDLLVAMEERVSKRLHEATSEAIANDGRRTSAMNALDNRLASGLAGLEQRFEARLRAVHEKLELVETAAAAAPSAFGSYSAGASAADGGTPVSIPEELSSLPAAIDQLREDLAPLHRLSSDVEPIRERLGKLSLQTGMLVEDLDALRTTLDQRFAGIDSTTQTLQAKLMESSSVEISLFLDRLADMERAVSELDPDQFAKASDLRTLKQEIADTRTPADG